MSIQDLKNYLGLYEKTITGGKKFLDGRRFINYVILQGLQGGEDFEDAEGDGSQGGWKQSIRRHQVELKNKIYKDAITKLQKQHKKCEEDRAKLTNELQEENSELQNVKELLKRNKEELNISKGQHKKYAQNLSRLERELKELQDKNIRLKNAQSYYKDAQAQLSKCKELSNQLRIRAEEAKKQEQIFRDYEKSASKKFQECSIKSRDQRRECQKKEQEFENEISKLRDQIMQIQRGQRESEAMHNMEKAKLQRKYDEANNLGTITRGYERQENQRKSILSEEKDLARERLNRRRQKMKM